MQSYQAQQLITSCVISSIPSSDQLDRHINIKLWLTSECRHLEVVHLAQGHQQGELILLDRELEQSPAPDDLEAGEDDPPDIHMGDEDIAGDLTDVLEEAQVKVLVLKPGQLQVAVHEGAVSVSVPEVPVVMLPVARHRHPPIRPDANWK